jgi:hypothetical protein
MPIIKINQKFSQKAKINITFLGYLDNVQNQTARIKIHFTRNLKPRTKELQCKT